MTSTDFGESSLPYSAAVLPSESSVTFRLFGENKLTPLKSLVAALLTRGGWARSWEPAAEYDLDVAWRLAERTEVIR